MKKYEVITTAPKISKKAGYIRPGGNKNNKDMWRIQVARKDSLWKLVNLIESNMKHENKLKRVNEIKENIILRNEIPYGHRINLQALSNTLPFL